jgi:hypothetical protein
MKLCLFSKRMWLGKRIGSHRGWRSLHLSQSAISRGAKRGEQVAEETAISILFFPLDQGTADLKAFPKGFAGRARSSGALLVFSFCIE